MMQRYISRDMAIELMDALLKEGFTVKVRGWRTRGSDSEASIVDKRKWTGESWFSVHVSLLTSCMDEAIRANKIAEHFGLTAWFGNDDEGEATMELKVGFRGADK